MSYPLHKIRDIHQRNLATLLSLPSMLNPQYTHPHSLSAHNTEPDLETLKHYFEQTEQVQHFQENISNNSRKRLGHYAEDLLSYWLGYIKKYPIQSNIQINDQGRSYGEFDLIFKAEEQWYWWELCIKYYCLDQDESQLIRWIGPNAKDSLARKYEHVFQQQLELHKHPVAADFFNSIHAQNSQGSAFFKGYLFVHLSHPLYQNCPSNTDVSQHLNPRINPAQRFYWYVFPHQIHEIPCSRKSSRFVIVKRHEWIAPVIRNPQVTDLRSHQQLIKELNALIIGGALMIIELVPDTDGWWIETQRGFIMPANWPNCDDTL